MIPSAFHPSEFDRNHVSKMEKWVEEKKKVKVLVELKPIERVLQQDPIGFYIQHDGERVAVRPDPNVSGVPCLVGLSPKVLERVRKIKKRKVRN